ARFEVRLRVGPLERRLVVQGPRRWERSGGRLVPGMATPFAELRLGWRVAFGGKDGDEAFAANPVGKGFWSRSARRDPEGLELPQVEDPDCLMSEPADLPAPACLEGVAPQGAPRVGLAGTYDEAWRRTRAPFVPDDFDPRFHHHGSGVLGGTARLVGGEPVELAGFDVEGTRRTRLPRLHPRLRLLGYDLVPVLGAVHLDAEEDLVALTYRFSLPVAGLIDAMPPLILLEKMARGRGGSP
ncbi:MAG: DUF2169 domain-containing protein, partial [Polyangiaceae bacterium]|nr:DUF2169 domain-containing protein [Polyangiaceae bacterium]